MKKILTLNNLFLLTIFCLPLYLLRVNIFGVPSNVFELLALLSIILAIFQEKNNFLSRILALPKVVLLACISIIVGILFSILLNENILTGLGILKGWFLVPIFFSFLLYVRLSSRSDVEKVFWALYSSACVVGIIALMYKVANIVTYDDRLSGFYLSPNHLAMYLTPGIIFGLYFLKKSYSKNLFSKYLLINSVFLILLFSALYLTYSYGAWVAFFISIFVVSLVVADSKKYFIIFLLAGFASMLTLFFVQKDTEKFLAFSSSSPRSSIQSRITIWQVSQSLVFANPLIGIGPGNFQTSYLSLQKHFSPYLEWAVPQPHNLLLAFWLQAGLIGLFGFSIICMLVFKMFYEIFKNKKDVALAAPLFGFFLYTFIHGLIDTTYWKNDLSILFWLCFFMALFLYNKISEKFKI